MAGLAYFEGLRLLGATAARVGAGSPAMLLSMVERLGATTIVSVPSFLKRVAMYAQQQGINLAQSTVKKLVCIGEPVRTADWRLTPLGNYISQAWGATVFSTCRHRRSGLALLANARWPTAAISILNFCMLKSSTIRASRSPRVSTGKW